ncbi:MAG TPA: queuosine salvage family protein [Thermomicrobiales bacterium]|nr:queuosine salvage family protein [Thermomicrobiales bacterium]
MSDKDVFAHIRAASAEVTRRASFVRLMSDQVAPYAASLAAAGLPEPVYDTAYHAHGAEADTVAFLLTLGTVNFGSGYFPHLRKHPGMSGYLTVASSLKARWERDGPLGGDELRAIDAGGCALLFGQVGNEGPAQELMGLFAQALNDLGAWLFGRYDDDPLGPIADADHSAARLVTLLAEMPYFRDVSSYQGVEVPLYKRAQLLATDLAIGFAGRGPGEFDGLGRLTIFADNLVPHVLRVDGLLEYDADLLGRIECGELIPVGSPEEVEIRAVAVHAVERIVTELRAAGVPATARELDYLLWNRGQGPSYKAQPRHRTRSVFY